MADQKTVEKVKELLNGHCYGPLREAAEKWLAVADEKYDVKDKAGKAWDKINDAADALVDASGKFNEKMGDVSEKVAGAADKIADKAAPAIDKAGEYAQKLADKTDIDDKIIAGVKSAAEKAAESELIAQLKEGVATLTENIDFFSKDEAKEKFGAEAAEQIKKHAEAMKAEGKEYCDCEACTKAREILKELGEDIGE